jgi:hypothetical protein
MTGGDTIDSVWDRKRAVLGGCADGAGWARISRGITFGGGRIWTQTGQGLARIAVA